MKKSDLSSLKSFRTGDSNIVKSCQSYFSFNQPTVLVKKRAEKFDIGVNIKVMQTCHAKWLSTCS